MLYSHIVSCFQNAEILHFKGKINLAECDILFLRVLLSYKQVGFPLLSSAPSAADKSPKLGAVTAKTSLKLPYLTITAARVRNNSEDEQVQEWLRLGAQFRRLVVLCDGPSNHRRWCDSTYPTLSQLYLLGGTISVIDTATFSRFVSNHPLLSSVLFSPDGASDIPSTPSQFCLLQGSSEDAECSLPHRATIIKASFKRKMSSNSSDFICTTVSMRYDTAASNFGPLIDVIADSFPHVQDIRLDFKARDIGDCSPVRFSLLLHNPLSMLI